MNSDLANLDMSMFHLVLNASFVVQMVMGALLLVSLISWTMIIAKRRMLGSARRVVEAFEQRFWSGGDFGGIYAQITERDTPSSGIESIFEAGFREFARLRMQQGIEPRAIVEGAQRAMRVVTSREVDRLETHLSFLATVGSTSPYVGLFGTVWGIMNSFRALGNVHNATLGMVAPGIAEALIATAMGLFAAIPAVIAYNRYSNDVDRLVNRYNTFAEEFSNVLQRQAHIRAQAAKPKPAAPAPAAGGV